MVSRLWNLALRLSARLGFGREWWMLAVAAGVGLFMGVAALAFIRPIQALEHAAEDLGFERPGLVLWLLPFVPLGGALLTGVLNRLLPTEFKGHGVSSVIFAVSRRQSRLRLRLLARQWLGSTLTIGSGGSAGPEGPIVTIGAVIGSNLARLLRLDAKSGTTLLGCGAAAGLASVFNAPLAGIFFVLEVLLRDFSLRTFTPIVVAAVLAAATTQTIIGSNQPIFGVGPEFFGDSDVPFTIGMAPFFALLGVASGLVAVVFTRSLQVSESLFARLPIPGMLRPAAGGMLLGLLGLGYMLVIGPDVFGREGDPVPPFFGNGYLVIYRLLEPDFYQTVPGSLLEKGWLLLLAALAMWAALKIVATSLTIGSGGAGGLFAPSLVLGAIVGSVFGVAVAHTSWFPDANPAHFALVGMAAMVAATTHAPMTAVLLVYELTRQYEFILPLILTAAIATTIAKRLAGESLYTAELAEAGIRVGRMSDFTLLRRMSVDELPLLPPVLVKPTDSSQRLLELAERFPVSDFVVVDDEERYLGLVVGEHLREALVYRESLPLLQVGELMRGDLPSLRVEDTLDRAVERFGIADVESLPVLDDQRRVLGMVTRTRLLRHYNRELEQD